MSETVSGKSAIALALFRVGALRFGKFSQPSGRTSSYHLDLGVVPSDTEAYGLAIAACESMVDSIGADNFDAIAGMDVLGIALASPLAHLLKKPLLCLRSEERGEALVWAVEGAARPRWRTLVIVDQAATDKSIGSAVDALRRTGCTVTEAMALVDREEGAKAKLATRGVGLNFFVGIRELAESLFQSRSITKENYGAVIKQTQKTTD